MVQATFERTPLWAADAKVDFANGFRLGNENSIRGVLLLLRKLYVIHHRTDVRVLHRSGKFTVHIYKAERSAKLRLMGLLTLHVQVVD